MKTCWYSLPAVLQLSSCFTEKLRKSTNPIEHKSHQNTELQGKGSKEKKIKIEAPFYLLSSLRSYSVIVCNFLSSARKAGNIPLALLFKILIYIFKGQIFSQGIPES